MPSETNPGSDEPVGAGTEDPLAEIDRLMRKRMDDAKRLADMNARLAAERSEFSAGFSKACDERVRPAMEAIVERLRRNGGGGLIVERPVDVSLHHDHRLTLWMSLVGEISGTPREDRLPYLQLDADVQKRSVIVSEGDMWEGHGGSHSGRTAEWQVSEITHALVTEEALAILRRAVG